MKPVKIPRRIDEPPHMLLWSADELAPMLLGLVIGVMMGKALIFFLIGLAVTNLYRRFRDNHPDGYMLHMLYWGGFIATKAKSLKNPFIRRYFP
ncbi:type IV conjugative transfer system protein TraL [Vibrio parahaemolyticus]|jgi:conjugal transfer pilus assembly protein TraL|uniref:Conjugal transfer protein TraL n=9 Tax=Vibrionaceae TaxID=641 RepID=A0A0C3DJR5_9VIBR|nr:MULTISPECIES: type IV conjugative transfer system protein TraL [Vibrionaceae]EKO3796601.1 type IV conjugative transfer system protein TraL [Vibrio metschnikovii]MBY8081928.1 type IV conjugative transfer system protein TraL [Vibrio fluvialis]MDW1968594.1 type IV conjugative transfer system protein TraL [Vibrio sp. 945]QLK49914.1 type IV conjugative transfer system protein TraL [Vibrio owensii]HDY8061153.1 type IV conjugative transfer system protein TraL [Vibrio vulnificus]